VLGAMNSIILATFNYWYVYVMAFFVILCFALALWPRRAGCDSATRTTSRNSPISRGSR
jgi:hypothetical protein